VPQLAVFPICLESTDERCATGPTLAAAGPTAH
jgi:hypothetical protein